VDIAAHVPEGVEFTDSFLWEGFPNDWSDNPEPLTLSKVERMTLAHCSMGVCTEVLYGELLADHLVSQADDKEPEIQGCKERLVGFARRFLQSESRLAELARSAVLVDKSMRTGVRIW
jgi:hypothetical protein